MKKRIVTMLLALSLASGLLAGCGESTASSAAAESAKPESAAAPTQETAAAPESAQEAEPSTAEESQVEEAVEFQLAETVDLPITDEVTTFSMWCGAPPGGLSVVGSPIMEYITEKTNISLELLEQNMMTANEKFNLMVASQDYPDIISGFDESYSGGAVKGYEDDVIIDLTDLVDENMPNYKTLIDTMDDYTKKSIYTDDDRILRIWTLASNVVSEQGLSYRADWAKEFGMNAPVTVDDMFDYLTAVKISIIVPTPSSSTTPLYWRALPAHSALRASIWVGRISA